jgi:hypothetical protein
MQKKACFARSKPVRSVELTDRYLCFSLKNTVGLLKAGGEFALRAMKRLINFSSIFRRKEEDQALPPRAPGDVDSVSSDLRPVDLDTVGGHITIPGEAIEGMLEGRARVRAAHLKSLNSSPQHRNKKRSRVTTDANQRDLARVAQFKWSRDYAARAYRRVVIRSSLSNRMGGILYDARRSAVALGKILETVL